MGEQPPDLAAAALQVLVDLEQELSLLHTAPAGRLCAWVGDIAAVSNVALMAVAWHARKGAGALWCTGPVSGGGAHPLPPLLAALGLDPQQHLLQEHDKPAAIREAARERRPGVVVVGNLDASVPLAATLTDLKLAARESGAAVLLTGSCHDVAELAEIAEIFKGVDVLVYLRPREGSGGLEVDALVEGGPIEHLVFTLRPPLPLVVDEPAAAPPEQQDRPAHGLRLVK